MGKSPYPRSFLEDFNAQGGHSRGSTSPYSDDPVVGCANTPCWLVTVVLHAIPLGVPLICEIHPSPTQTHSDENIVTLGLPRVL